MMEEIPGYEYGKVPKAPISKDDLELLKKTVMFSEEDRKYLRMAGEILKEYKEEILDLWYGWVGSNPHLVYYFSDLEGKPIKDYLDKVRKRFGQWIIDTCFRDYDENWLNYSYEIGLRHNKSKKNKTDGVKSVPHIPLRYLIAFIYPITATIKPFLARKGHGQEDIERMYNAWFKSLTLQVAIWSYPYAEEDW